MTREGRSIMAKDGSLPNIIVISWLCLAVEK